MFGEKSPAFFQVCARKWAACSHVALRVSERLVPIVWLQRERFMRAASCRRETSCMDSVSASGVCVVRVWFRQLLRLCRSACGV